MKLRLNQHAVDSIRVAEFLQEEADPVGGLQASTQDIAACTGIEEDRVKNILWDMVRYGKIDVDRSVKDGIVLDPTSTNIVPFGAEAGLLIADASYRTLRYLINAHYTDGFLKLECRTVWRERNRQEALA